MPFCEPIERMLVVMQKMVVYPELRETPHAKLAGPTLAEMITELDGKSFLESLDKSMNESHAGVPEQKCAAAIIGYMAQIAKFLYTHDQSNTSLASKKSYFAERVGEAVQDLEGKFSKASASAVANIFPPLKEAIKIAKALNPSAPKGKPSADADEIDIAKVRVTGYRM